MALNAQQLEDAFIATFRAAAMKGGTTEQVAHDLAQAIHAYVGAGVVDGIGVDVVDLADQALGTGKQQQPVQLT
jgi:hypothetical protein